MVMNQGSLPASDSDTRLMAILGYILFLVGWPTVHLATVGGVVLAYVKRGDARGTIWESHFSNMIETFWISFALAVVAIPLCFVVVGFFLLGFVALWFFYRTIKGLIRAIEGQPYR
ncbi:MAG: hypothetical protein JOZ72_08700 [Alphaproteobacteria bacterium]|nr:hypothetical protein [Alphaproteobacteria bacterium]